MAPQFVIGQAAKLVYEAVNIMIVETLVFEST